MSVVRASRCRKMKTPLRILAATIEFELDEGLLKSFRNLEMENRLRV